MTLTGRPWGFGTDSPTGSGRGSGVPTVSMGDAEVLGPVESAGTRGTNGVDDAGSGSVADGGCRCWNVGLLSNYRGWLVLC